MSVHTAETPFGDPRYRRAMQHLQGGEWEAGLAELDNLVESYPLDRELRALRQEMQLRAQIDEDERLDINRERRRKFLFVTFRLAAIVLLAGLAFWAVRTYSAWFQQQVVVARERLDSELQVIELAAKFRDGQDLVIAGRAEEAIGLFQEISVADPNYPGIEEALKQAEKQKMLEGKYLQALTMIDSGDLPGALGLFEEISSEEPYYKDVSIRMAEIKDKFFLGDILAQAERAYEGQDWSTAVARYETLRALDPLYQSELVEDRLFEAYMNAAVNALAENTESLEGLNLADSYFRKALALRPQDQVIRQEQLQARQTFKDRLFGSFVNAAQTALAQQPDSLQAQSLAEEYYNKAIELRPDDVSVRLQREMAKLYLQAQVDFSRGRWDAVIEALETVYEADPEYALGTTRQTLYEALVGRGNQWVASGEYEMALQDYQQAAVLAEQAPDVRLRLLESQIKVAEVRGVLGDYENAVVIYRGAIENAEVSDADLQGRSDLAQKLSEAELYAQGRNFRQAYRLYREAAREVLLIFPTVEYVVQSGDYLTMLASRYQTTVDAIAQANNLDSARKISIGQKLIIPVQDDDNGTGQ
ncbi:MAG TPA: LysM peptidoglycan-binding domain-containing protein [Anaerolineales bacterium]|nr:LysM peptidoglycan-binding domain-containing protein [Anaerolineales bacterium]